MRKKDIKVQVTLTEGYQERFTAACVKVAMRRIEQQEREAAQVENNDNIEAATA